MINDSMAPAANENARPMTVDAATRAVRAGLHWEVGTPGEEKRMGAQEGRYIARQLLNDRAALVRILDALDRDPLEAVAELQCAEPFASESAGLVNLALFESYLFGPLSGGVDGTYGRAFMAELRAVAPFVASLN